MGISESKFKVGDKVKIIKDDNRGEAIKNIGKVGKIVLDDGSDTYPYKVRAEGLVGSDGEKKIEEWFNDEELELAESKQELKFRVGDKFKDDEDIIWLINGIKEGENYPYQVEALEVPEKTCCDWEVGDETRFKDSGDMELVENEFKVGDEVEIFKGARLDNSPSWNTGMDKFIGEKHTIVSIVSENNIDLKGAEGWQWAERWLKPVQKQEQKVETKELISGDFQMGWSTMDVPERKWFLMDNQFQSDPPEKRTMLQRLTSTLKRVLPTAMREQYRAGLRNGELGLTAEGRNEVLEFMASTKDVEAHLVKVAGEIIKEEKEDN